MKHRIETIEGGYQIIADKREYKIIITQTYIGIEDSTAYIPIPRKLGPIFIKVLTKALEEAK